MDSLRRTYSGLLYPLSARPLKYFLYNHIVTCFSAVVNAWAHLKILCKTPQPNQYRGVYIWDSMESLLGFRESELAATIPSSHRVKDVPQVEVGNISMQ